MSQSEERESSDRPRSTREDGFARVGDNARLTLVPPRIAFAGFERHLVVPKRPWAGLAASLLVHCALGCLVWVGGFYVRTSRGDPPLEVRLREATHVYVQLRDVPLRIDRGPPGDSGEAPGGHEWIPRIAARRFQLPPLPRRIQVDQTLLQPDVAPDVAPDPKLRLPEFMVWSPDPPKVKRPVPKKLVIPGRKDPVNQQPTLAAAPSLALSASESIASDLTALESALNTSAKLKLPPRARVVPIRTFSAPAKSAVPTTSLDLLPGDPSAVIALNPDPAAMSALVVVPGGNQIGRLPPNPGGDVGGVTARAASAGQLDTGRTTFGANGAGTGTGGIKGGSGSDPSASGRSGAGSGGSGASGSGGAGSAAGTLIGASSPATAAPPLVQTHPKNGVFDVVVAHPSPPPDVPNAKLRLKGSPVYTVYLNVGKSPEWILRYCATSGPRVSSGGNVIQLGNPAPITPPYPQVTVVPPFDGSRDKMAVLHGFLTPQGQFRSLQAVRSEDELMLSRIEPLLSQWVFRPATRDGVPVEIEILLLLPRLFL